MGAGLVLSFYFVRVLHSGTRISCGSHCVPGADRTRVLSIHDGDHAVDSSLRPTQMCVRVRHCRYTFLPRDYEVSLLTMEKRHLFVAATLSMFFAHLICHRLASQDDLHCQANRQKQPGSLNWDCFVLVCS